MEVQKKKICTQEYDQWKILPLMSNILLVYAIQRCKVLYKNIYFHKNKMCLKNSKE